MADLNIIADSLQNRTVFDADTSFARNASVAPGNNGNGAPSARRTGFQRDPAHDDPHPDRTEKVRLALAAAKAAPGIWQSTFCLEHEDSRPSGSVMIDAKGTLAVKCHSQNCRFKDIKATLKLRGLLPGRARLVKIYRYEYEDGSHAFNVEKYFPKDFRQRASDGRPTVKGIKLVPFKLRELIAAPAGDWILENEGEEGSLIAISLGFTGTNSPGGAGKFRPEYAQYFVDRKVVWIADNDAPGERHVKSGAQILKPVVAEQKILRLPGIPAGRDLRDWVRAGGTAEDLKALIAATPSITEKDLQPDEAPSSYDDEALRKTNDKYAVIHEPPAIINVQTGKLIDYFKFTKLILANQYILRDNAKGEPKMVSLGSTWIQWPDRREHTGIVYEPGQPKVLANNDYNTWKPGCQARPGDVTPWHNLMEHLFRGKPPFMRQWFEKWAAYPLQFPGTKLHTAVVVYGATQGSGKSITGDMIRGVYGDNAVEIDKSSLSSNFNSYIAKRQFISSSDISARKDLRLDAEQLKTTITRSDVEVNTKYAPKYFLGDCVNWYFSSNHFAAVYADNTDRRYFFVHIEEKLPTELSDPLRAWRNKPDGQFENYQGFGPLLHYFLNLDLGDFDPRAAAPLTPDRDDVIDAGRSNLDAWCQDLKADPMPFLRGFTEGFTERDLWHIDELMVICRIHQGNGVSRKALVGALRKGGFIKLDPRVRTARGRLQLWVLVNVEKWCAASEREIATYYNSFQPDPPKF